MCAFPRESIRKTIAPFEIVRTSAEFPFNCGKALAKEFPERRLSNAVGVGSCWETLVKDCEIALAAVGALPTVEGALTLMLVAGLLGDAISNSPGRGCRVMKLLQCFLP